MKTSPATSGVARISHPTPFRVWVSAFSLLLLALLVFAQPAAKAQTAAAITYTNSASTNWSLAAAWTGGSVAPPNGGSTNATIWFAPAGTEVSTNNLPGGFVLNQMILAVAQTTTLYVTNNTVPPLQSLNFTNSVINSVDTQPLLTNTAAKVFTINSWVTLGTNLTVVP